MTTLLQLREAVQDATGRKIGSSATQVNKLVNDAYLQVVLDGRLSGTSASMLLTSSATGDYSVATDLAITNLDSIDYITFTGGGTTAVATPTTLAEILNLRGANGQAITPYLYALTGFDLLSIYPTPATTDTGTIYYWARPTSLAADGDSVNVKILPAEFHDLIELKAMVRSARTVDKGDSLLGVQMSQQYQALYSARLLDLKRWRNRVIGSQNGYVQIGQPRHPTNRNDQYWRGDSL